MAKVTVRVPATSANLGPGFDCLGLALGLYNYVILEERSAEVKLTVEGEGAALLSSGPDNLVARAVERVFQETGRRPGGYHLYLKNAIPLARGLGSSAAAIVGGLVAANLLTGAALTKERLLELALEFEGHADNVSAALNGGLTISALDEGGRVNCMAIAVPPGLKAAVVVPSYQLATGTSREVLPLKVERSACVFNISRAALLVAALTTGQLDYLPLACADRLHQPYRLPLVPGMDVAVQRGLEAGALAVTLSGSGPTLLALGNGNLDQILAEMLKALADNNVEAAARELELVNQGAWQNSILEV